MSVRAVNQDRKVELVEVAPRDGFQSIDQPIPTAEKIAIIDGLLAARFRRMEIGSFVNPRAVPQMADMAQIAATFKDREGARLSVLVPNEKGVELALANGCRDLVFVVSVSETHNQRYVRQSVEESLEALRAVAATLGSGGGRSLRIDLGTAFDCPFHGTVPMGSLRRAFLSACDVALSAEFALCDTTGRADPHSVRTRFASLMEEETRSELGVPRAQHLRYGGSQLLLGLRCRDRGDRCRGRRPGWLPFRAGRLRKHRDGRSSFRLQTGIDLEGLLDVADRIAELPGGQTESHLRRVPRERISQVLSSAAN